uniref:Solute carrier family 22 member 13a n=1 Tax=Seriola lalandi dorsalis TaxID=1841481 RepID=A0A3B4WJJ4_SERLL
MADFGEILRNIGEFGLFQQLTLIALCFPNLFLSFMFASFIFIESDPERHCNTDWILRADPNLTTDEQLNLTLPREEDGTFSRCRMFVPVDRDIGSIREYGLNETSGCQSGWLYYNALYEFDLVCDKANLVEVAQTVFLAGILIGSLTFGPFAESFGRKRATQIPLVIMFIFTVSTALCPNIYLYLVLQFFSGVGAGGYRVNCIILSTEWIGMSKRSWGVCVTQLFGALGQCVLAGVIYAIRDWRLAQLITAAPLGVVVIYIWCVLPVSARWLLNRGRTEEAKQLIVKAAAINKRSVPDSLLEKVLKLKLEATPINAVYCYRCYIIQCRTLSMFFLFLRFSLNLALYCLYLNMGNFGLSIFVTQLLFGAIEIPANLFSMWLLEVFGRRVLFIATLLAGGLSCILILAVPQGYAVAVTSLAAASRFFLIWAGSVCSVFMQELTPTSVRQTATALGAISGRTGGLLAPLLNILAMYHWVIPITVFSSLTLVSGALGFLLPETRRKELPETKLSALLADEFENIFLCVKLCTAKVEHTRVTINKNTYFQWSGTLKV